MDISQVLNKTKFQFLSIFFHIVCFFYAVKKICSFDPLKIASDYSNISENLCLVRKFDKYSPTGCFFNSGFYDLALQLADLKVTETVFETLLKNQSNSTVIKAVTRILVKPFRSLLSPPAVIQSFFGIFEIGRTFFNTIQRRFFKYAKTLLVGQILL